MGFFVWITIPRQFSGSRFRSPANTCINNLRQIDAAANEFAREKGKTNGEPINFPDDLTPYINIGNPKLFMGGEASGAKLRPPPTVNNFAAATGAATGL